MLDGPKIHDVTLGPTVEPYTLKTVHIIKKRVQLQVQVVNLDASCSDIITVHSFYFSETLRPKMDRTIQW